MGTYAFIEDKYYDFMGALKEKLHLPVDQFFIEPIESRGIPSFPIFIILILAILGGTFLALQPAPQKPLELQVLLTTPDGTPVAGITVNIFMHAADNRDPIFGKKAGSETSNELGIAEFSGLEKGVYLIKIEPQGFEPTQKEVNLAMEGKASITLIPIIKEIVTVFLATDADGRALDSVLLEITAGGARKNALTDSGGKAQFSFPERSQLAVSASKEGYEGVSLSLRNFEGTSSVRLAKKKITGRLQVRVTDEAGKAIGAAVRLYPADAAIDPLFVASTIEGVAVFATMEMGQRLRAVASSEGYKDGRQEIAIKEDTRIAFRLEKLPFETKPSNSTSIKVIDAEGKAPIAKAQIYLFNLQNELLTEGSTGAQGILELNLRLGTYYAVVTAEGFVYSKLFIAGGESKSIGLMKERPDSTVNLNLKIINEDGKAAMNASLLFLDEDGNVAPPLRARASSKGEFASKMAKQYYNVKAFEGALFGERAFNLNASISQEIVLLYPRGKISLTALDLDSNKSIISEKTPSFQILAIDSVNKKISSASCKANPCEMELIAQRRHDLNISASGYFATEYSVLDGELKPGETLQRTAYLKNTTSTTRLKIQFMGIVDFQNSSKTITKITPGATYAAKFVAYFDEDAKRSGIFLRVGSEFEAEGIEGGLADGVISAFSIGGSPAPSSVKGSNSYLQGVCQLFSNPGKARYAFADYGQKGVQTFYIGLKANPSKGAPDNFEFFYGAYTQMRNGSLASDPQGISALDDCSMPIYSASIPFGDAIKPNASVTPSAMPSASAKPSASPSPRPSASPSPSPSPSASPGPNINECPLLKVTKSNSNALSASCTRIIMKVDSIFPADAIELKFSSADGKATAQKIEFLDENGNALAGCLAYDVAKSVLAYNPAAGSCPDRYKPEGNSVPSATFTMKVTMALADNPVEIPIIVLNDEGFPEGKVGFEAIEASSIEYRSEDILPLSYYWPDIDSGTPLRLTYVLNNRQHTFENDALSAEEGGSKLFDLLTKDQNRGGAALFGWDTDATPDLAIAQRTAAIIFPSQNSVGVGSLLELLGPDAHASKASSEARIGDFLELAKATAANSVFRRGGTKPYSYFADIALRPVAFSAVISESADNMFNNIGGYGMSIDTQGVPDTCRARLGIYKLSVSTKDGLAWNYGSDDAKLSGLSIEKTAGNPSCKAIAACNLFDGYYGLINTSSDSGKRHCFGYEWPIVPYGNQLINGKSLDLRNAIYLGIGNAAILEAYNEAPGENAPNPPEKQSILDAKYPVFVLTAPQNASLDSAAILYKMNVSEEVLSVGAYDLGGYPDVFS